MSLVSFSNWVSTAAVSLYFPPLLSTYGLTKSFIAFSLGSLSISLFAQFFIENDKKNKDNWIIIIVYIYLILIIEEEARTKALCWPY